MYCYFSKVVGLYDFELHVLVFVCGPIVRAEIANFYQDYSSNIVLVMDIIKFCNGLLVIYLLLLLRLIHLHLCGTSISIYNNRFRTLMLCLMTAADMTIGTHRKFCKVRLMTPN